MGIHDSHENVQALLYAKKELLGLIVAVSLLGIQRMFPELKQIWNTLQIWMFTVEEAVPLASNPGH